MEFSKRILERKNIFIGSSAVGGDSFDFKLPVLNEWVKVKYDVKSEDELNILSIETNLKGSYANILDALMELVSGRPIGSLNRINSKELDHFLRDERYTPALSFYSPEFLDLFSLNTALYKKLSGIEAKELKAIDNFFELSFSEQIEFLEEVMAQGLYENPKFFNVEIDLEDVGDEDIILAVNKKLSDEERTLVTELFKSLIPNLKSIRFED